MRCFHEIFAKIPWEWISVISTPHCGKSTKSVSPKIYISWNQFFSNFFNKNVAFTKFLSKNGESKLRNFHTSAHAGILQNFREINTVTWFHEKKLKWSKIPNLSLTTMQERMWTAPCGNTHVNFYAVQSLLEIKFLGFWNRKIANSLFLTLYLVGV